MLRLLGPVMRMTWAQPACCPWKARSLHGLGRAHPLHSCWASDAPSCQLPSIGSLYHGLPDLQGHQLLPAQSVGCLLASLQQSHGKPAGAAAQLALPAQTAVKHADECADLRGESVATGSSGKEGQYRRGHLRCLQRGCLEDSKRSASPGQQLCWRRQADLQLHGGHRCSHAWSHTRLLPPGLLEEATCWIFWVSAHPGRQEHVDCWKWLPPCASVC